MQLTNSWLLFPSTLGYEVVGQSQNILGNLSADKSSQDKVLSIPLTHSQNNLWACLIYICVLCIIPDSTLLHMHPFHIGCQSVDTDVHPV